MDDERNNPDGPTAPTGTQEPESETRQGRRLPPAFESLRNRNFRLLWFGQLGQASAMWADQVARSWLTWQITGSATAVGLVNFFRAIPLITLGLLGGVIADRFDKRTILIVIQTWSLCVYVVMAVLLLGDWIELWHVYFTALLLGGGMALNSPVRTSLIPQLLDGRLLVNAMSLNSIAINVTRLTGPAAIGFMIALAGDDVAPAYVVAVIVYVIIIFTTIQIDFKSTQASGPRPSFVSDLIEGFRYLALENRTAMMLVVLAAGPLAFAHSYVTLLPVFVTTVLDGGSSGFGLIQSVSAVGALVGGFTLASLRDVRHKGRIMMITGLSYGVLVLVLGSVTWTFLAFGIVVFIGASQTVFRTSNNSSLLEITPRRLQGRVLSVTALDMGVQALAAVLAGAITDAYSVAVGMAVLGGMCLVIVAIVGIGAPAIRRL
ncbi:MAG: MFS transporter [SAR202 cluster bacterium]|nr:MFS transporter [SAR202 cluster bacterium]MDP7412960.1 MFS transporter [SAR202 cluster bacterium]MDP7533425.1 MFS transporter [SAR202 cluster bacterium]